MKNLQLILMLMLFSLILKAQTLTSSSLPIVIINTDKDLLTGNYNEIPDDPKIVATMKIIFRPDSSRNFLSDQNNPLFLDYNGRIKIETRGSTSQLLPKKPYGLTTVQNDHVTNNNVSILGMPKENDWILNALDYDESLIRTYLSYNLSGKMGNYASRGVYCEVIVNDDYKGLYVIMEKLKIETERINIIKLTGADTTSPNVTGGYITKSDKTTGGDPVAWSMPSYNTTAVDFIHESPKPADITPQQNAYIFNEFADFQKLISSRNSAAANGYPSVIDIPSFVDFMLVNELASNVDAYQYSTFYHKDRNGKLRAGPVWDFNLTYGNDLKTWGFDRSFTNVWQFDNENNTGAKFWKDLYDDPVFRCYLSKRWNEVTKANQSLNYDLISARIDKLITVTEEASIREHARWNTIPDRTANVSALKSWLQERIKWLDSKLIDYQACTGISLPALVISKIHYNPVSSQGKTGNDLEFIEISNNSDKPVKLTGFYFRELGITYQFPSNGTINANDKLYLASNMLAFQQFYGISPFGQFTRNLSNKSQKLVLADAYGNVIDQVEYFDSAPWPADADGTGAYLQLTNPEDDNSLASSWIASSVVLGLEKDNSHNIISIYPNPALKEIHVNSNQIMISYQIRDLTGQLVTASDIAEPYTFTVNMEDLNANIYLLKINYANGTTIIRKVTKF